MEPTPSTVETVLDLPGARPLSGAPRPVRHLAPPEVPWPGRRATDGDTSCFLVDAPVLRSWPGWDADPAGHVLAPIDIVRRPDGHDVVLPLCTERLVRFLQRRAGRSAPLSPGEAITVLVSILRGTADALMRSARAAGEWWLTDAGKPVFVHGDGPDAIMAADVCLAALGDVIPDVAHLRDRLGAGEQPSRSSATADLAHPRALAAALPEVEAGLFARSAPEPLATTDLAPARARTVAAVPEHTGDLVAHSSRGRWNALSRFVDEDLRDVAAAGWDALRQRHRRRRISEPAGSASRRPRRRVVVVAGLAAAGVVTAGLLWPHEGGGLSAGRSDPGAVAGPTVSVAPSPSTPARTRTPAPTSPPGSNTPTPGVPSDPDVAGAIRALLTARIACGGDAACRGSYAEDAAHHLPRGAVDDPRQAVVLLDEFGGAAVARVTSPIEGSGRSQLVVVVRTNQKWLIRDVSDAADQPN